MSCLREVGRVVQRKLARKMQFSSPPEKRGIKMVDLHFVLTIHRGNRDGRMNSKLNRKIESGSALA